MPSDNISTCIAPSIFACDIEDPKKLLDFNVKINKITAFMIENTNIIFPSAKRCYATRQKSVIPLQSPREGSLGSSSPLSASSPSDRSSTSSNPSSNRAATSTPTSSRIVVNTLVVEKKMKDKNKSQKRSPTGYITMTDTSNESSGLIHSCESSRVVKRSSSFNGDKSRRNMKRRETSFQGEMNDELD